MVRWTWCVGVVLAGCSGDPATDGEQPTVPPGGGLPLLGDGSHSTDFVDVTVIGTGNADELSKPTDLDFHPDKPDELWVVNQSTESVSIFWNTGTAEQQSTHAQHPTGEHFLARPAGMAFGENGLWASIHDHNDSTQGGATGPEFMGPTLWSGDRDVFDGGDESHLDMLHNSPMGKGIAWDGPGNRYWVFDGEHQSLTLYDFNDDHGLGGTDHTDGDVSRWVEGEVKQVKSVPAHLDMDHETGLLYVADSGNARIATLDTTAGERGDDIGPNFDGTDQYAMVQVSTETLIEADEVGMGIPIGIALHDGMLFVSATEPDGIYAFELDGTLVDWLALDHEPNGITFSEADGGLYYVSPKTDQVLRIQPKG